MIFSSSKSYLVRQLQGPIEGTNSVLTFDSKLSVISNNNHLYIWQWDDLKKWPVVCNPQTSLITPINHDKIVYNPSANSGKLILTDLKTEKELANLSLPYGDECKKIKASYNGRFGVVSMISKDGDDKGWFKLAVFDSDFKNLSILFQKDTNTEDFLLYDFAITDDSALLACVGRKGKAWVFVKDIKNDKILWGKTFDEYSQFSIVEFSPDGKTLYIAERVRYTIAFDSATGNIIRVYEIPKYNTPANQKQNISSIAISPDGRILAVDTEPAGVVWFWDISTGQKIGQISASALTVSDIAFSPDSKYLATGCLVKPEIKIWKVPQLK